MIRRFARFGDQTISIAKKNVTARAMFCGVITLRLDGRGGLLPSFKLSTNHAKIIVDARSLHRHPFQESLIDSTNCKYKMYDKLLRQKLNGPSKKNTQLFAILFSQQLTFLQRCSTIIETHYNFTLVLPAVGRSVTICGGQKCRLVFRMCERAAMATDPDST